MKELRKLIALLLGKKVKREVAKKGCEGMRFIIKTRLRLLQFQEGIR